MRISLLQPDMTDFDFNGNLQKIASLCNESPEAHLYIAPAEAITGPTRPCLASLPGWPQQGSELAQTLASLINANRALLTSLPALGPIFLSAGAFRFQVEPLCLNGLRMTFSSQPVPDADVLIHLSSRPFSGQLQSEWELMLAAQSRQREIVTLAPSLVGGYGSVIYSGQSMALNKYGQLAARGKAFQEDVLNVDLGESITGRIEPSPEKLNAQWDALCLGLSDFFLKSGASKAVLGLSGGMDSALVACIAADALGAQNITGILLPSPYTSQESIHDAEALAKNLNINTYTIPISAIFSEFKHQLEPVFSHISAIRGDLTEENLQARIRGVLLMAFANRTGALVLNTGNKSEAAMGYCTLYGDTAGAIAVIGDLFKTQVYELAAWYCASRGNIIPANIFTKAPTAELRPNQKDTDSLPPYSELDKALEKAIRGEGDTDLSEKARRFEFKRRQSPPPLLVSGLPLSRLC